MTEYGPFTRALITLASQGGRPPCGTWAEHNLWLSEDHEERARAAKLCTGCPVIVECGEAAEANGERFGVWGGADAGTTARRRQVNK